MSEVKLALIAAMARNRVIGRDNAMPWHLPEDLRYFKATTLGKPIVMGRKTFDSLGRPLPSRTNIVVSRQPDLTLEGAQVFASIDAALSAARQQAQADGVDEVMVIGGDNLYRQTLERADRIYLTRIDSEPEGDAWFPAFDEQAWTVVKRACGGSG